MKNRSLKFKLLLGGLTLVTMPLLIIGLFSINKASVAINNLAEERAIQIAADATRMVESYLQEESKIAKEIAAGNTTIATAEKVSRVGVAESKVEIENLTRKLTSAVKMIGEDYEALFVAGLDGKIYADGTGGKSLGINVLERDYFKGAVNGKVTINTTTKSKQTGSPVMPVAAPVFSTDGKVVGVLGIIIKAEYFPRMLSQIKVGKTGYVWMIDNTGLFIAHPKADYILSRNISQIDGMGVLAKEMLAGKSGVEPYVFDEIHKTCGFAPIPVMGWSVAATQNTDEYMAYPNYIRKIILLVGGLFLLVASILILWFSRRITAPLQRIISGLNEGSDHVATAASQVSSASQSLASGSSEQASAIEETSASIEEMSSMIQQNADNSGQTDALMREANKMVADASHAMQRLTQSMSDISSASQQTSKIIKTIDEIAFQTNLLALNAAVEAARAGEAGAGFAVVADEVRNLAIRSAEAAKTTAELIEETVNKVQAGTELLNSAFSAFSHMKESSSKVGDLVAEIATASKEQSVGIKQISAAISEMDKVTQQNAATAEESAAASQEMNAQADQMKAIVRDLLAIVAGDTKTLRHQKDNPSKLNKIKNDGLSGRSEKKSIKHEPKSNKSSAQRLLTPLDDMEFQEF
jgi:methyl-accepting chemotaxis protein